MVRGGRLFGRERVGVGRRVEVVRGPLWAPAHRALVLAPVVVVVAAAVLVVEVVVEEVVVVVLVGWGCPSKLQSKTAKGGKRKKV